MKTFLKEVLLPLLIALCLAAFFKPVYMADGVCDYFLMWLCVGFPFGIRRMCLWLVPFGYGISGTVGIFALNIIIGGLIAAVCLLQLKGVVNFLGVDLTNAAELGTAVFTLFVFCQLANALAARRPEGGNPLGGLTGNPALVGALFIAAVLQWVIVVWGGAAFGTVALGVETWVRILLVAACVPIIAALLPRSRT